MNNWIILFIAITAEVIATSALKSSEGFTKPIASIVVVVGYVVAFYCLSLTLKTIPVGVAYAIWSGVGIVLITTVAWFVFDQKLDIWGIIGIVLIMSGVLILNLLSKTSSH
ncbi:multidrug efflux SMR transporter [Acinetobacter dispersus]|uniref:DMT family transporter n=1 Tax=Acinetobacter dispersus TaxID=70348 RepID=UPI001F4ACFC5|nr:multidrug efflux SMR transporter [Acinetobacter dispersus]MCH7393075.1 multidrug efflux SMR transporter [Acinetobacter dispersus]